MLLLDYRFGSKQKGHKSYHDLRPRFDRLGTPYSVIDVGVADVLFGGNGPDGAITVGIEIKTLDDLLASVESERLQHKQLPKLAECDRRYLLVVGRWISNAAGDLILRRYDAKGGEYWKKLAFGKRVWKFNMISGFLCSAAEFYDARLMIVDNDTDAARWIHDIWCWWQKPWEEHQTRRIMPKPPARKGVQIVEAPKQAAHAALVKQMGWDRALRAKEKFGTVRAMAEASEKEWMEIEGVGKTLAKKAVEEFQT